MFDFLFTKALSLIVSLKYIGLLITSLGFPVPIEMVIAILASANGSKIWEIALVSASGGALGFQFPYLFGRLFTIKNPNTWLGGRAKFLRIDINKLEKSRKSILKSSFLYTLVTRFLPWLRVAASMAAGFFRVNFFIHTTAVFIGMFIYSLAIAYIGKQLSGDMDAIIRYIKLSDKWLLIIALTILILYIGFKQRKNIVKLIIKTSKK